MDLLREYRTRVVADVVTGKLDVREAAARLPEDVTVHVLPTGQTDPPRYNDLSQLRYRDTSHIAESITRARAATARYLDAIAPEAA